MCLCVCVCPCVCWHNRKALVYSGLACVWERTVGPGEQGFRGDHEGEGSLRVPLLSRNDSPGHVTIGSHRGTGQSETRGQRVRAACLFHCLCGVPQCWMQTNQSWNISITHHAQTGLDEAGQRQHCASLSLGTNSTAAESISSSFICLCASSVSGSSFVCFLMAERERRVCLPLSLFVQLNSSPFARAGCKSNNN